MGYEVNCAIRNNVAITSTGWTDVGGNGGGAYPLPISCNCIVVINSASSPILLATNPGNSNSTVEIPAGASWQLGVAMGEFKMGGPTMGSRFQSGSPNAACSLQSTSGSLNITLEFIL
jgi:hypothetical protein